MKVIINDVEYIVPQLPINDETVVNGKINGEALEEFNANFVYPTASDIGSATMVSPGTVLTCGKNKCTIVNTYDNIPSSFGSYFGIDAIFEFGGIDGQFTLNNFYTRLNATKNYYNGCYQYLTIFEDNYMIGGVTRLNLNNMSVSAPQGTGRIEGKIVDGKFVLPPPINNSRTLWTLFIAGGLFESPDDPYKPGGSTEPGGGSGSFDGTGDDVNIPSLPTLSATNTGFITLFNPSAEELRNLADYMWSNLFDLNAWKKIFADPMDAILGLSIVPVAVPNGGQAEVTVGNIPTGISMNRAGAQYVSVDCGTLNIEEYWGGYLDYDPYTKAEIYLPYIGIHPLSVDDIMGKTVHVVYHIDILSGACCAFVKCGGSVLYSFVGQCSCSIPITGNDWTNVISGALSIAASIGTMVATGGASAPMSIGAIASTAVNSMKPNVEKSGSMGGMGGMLGVQTPYLILTRPRQAVPKYQNKFSGYPSFITMSLGECSGYTEVDTVHLENIAATEQELSEIESLLKGGVIL